MRARAEPFGAWVRAGDGTLVAVTRSAARRLGVDGAALWEDGARAAQPRPPLEVHVAVTARCGAGCEGCYVDARPDGEAPPFDELAARIRAVARAGAFTVAFGGGEPLTRPDLGALARVAREAGLLPVMTTSGFGLTRERARELASFAQINVSYDGASDDYAAVRGFDGAPAAERAMGHLADAGVPFGVNVVLTRRTLPGLDRTVARAEALGAREAQLLRYKPAGRARSASYLATRLSEAQVDALLPGLEAIAAAHPSIALRVDCALVPLLGAGDVERLGRFGVFGCQAGAHLAAVRVDGALAPCSFGPGTATTAPAAFTDGAAGWASDATLAAWRELPAEEPCRSCPIRSVCRGGCKVVAAYQTGELGPDPECPRVRQWSRLRSRAD
jgi:radical SAM protein with 4Fe4S-binding SPASM domain